MDKGLENILANINLDYKNIKLAIVASRFNPKIIDFMIQGAMEQLLELGFAEENIDIFRVPGAFELPLACKMCARSNTKYAGVIALGAVIRGDTDHYNYICNEATRGLMKIMLKFDLPIAMGILTTDTYQQALARADIKQENKGAEVTRSLLEMIALKYKLLYSG